VIIMSTQPRKSPFAALKSSINIVSAPEAQQRSVDAHQGREETAPLIEPQPEPRPKASITKHPQQKPAKTTRRADPTYQQINIYVPKHIHRAIRIELVKNNDRDMSELVEELLLGWLKKKGATI
jgi:hypothetical protein